MRFGLFCLVILSLNVNSYAAAVCREFQSETDLVLGSTISITGQLDFNPEIIGIGPNPPKEFREVSLILKTKVAFFNESIENDGVSVSCSVDTYTLQLSDDELAKAKEYIKKNISVTVTGVLAAPKSKIEVYNNGVLLKASVAPAL